MPLPRWSFSSSPSSPSPNNRRLTRAKQIRHLRDCDLKYLDFFLKSPPRHRHGNDNGDDFLLSSSCPSPQPLPLPESSPIISPDNKSKSVSNSKRGDYESFRLPSPTEVAKDKERASDFNLNARRLVPLETQKSVDAQKRVHTQRGIDGQTLADSHYKVQRAETWSSWSVPHNMHRVQENLSIDITFPSAPPSSNSSPIHSPENGVLYGDPFYLYPMESTRWSEPAMPTAFPYGGPPERNIVSRDTSPFRSPLVKSPIQPRKSTSTGPPSSMPRLSIEISSPHYDNNALVNVHPLPLPPTPSSSVPASPVPQLTRRPELLPLKGQWTKGKLIGRGTFGYVFVATNRETGALCAMKEVELCPGDPKAAECMRQLQQEIECFSHLKHPNIVQYYGSEIVDDKFCIYLEYVYPGSINKYIREHCGAIPEAVVRNFTRHILSGLAYLHSRKTIHRDIKGANLLVDACGVVKLADFGMAKHLTGQVADLSLKGSPYWMAPELMQAVMHKDKSADLAFAVDIWSLGCTVIEMLTGKPPWSEFEGAAAMFKVLKESPPIPENLSFEGKDFLRCCFQRDPADRPPASKLMDHPFLRISQQLDSPPSNQTSDLRTKVDKVAHSPREINNHQYKRMQISPKRWTLNGSGYIK
ncbi:unnamed protein product [Amaranthus hypochondriacus]